MALFGPSKSDLQEQIDSLQSEVRGYRTRLADAEAEAREAKLHAKENEMMMERHVYALHKRYREEHDLGVLPKRFDNRDHGFKQKTGKNHVGYKAVRNVNGGMMVAELLIPEDTIVVSPSGRTLRGRKLRAEKARVLSFWEVENDTLSSMPNLDEHSLVPTVMGTSRYNREFEYHVGEEVTPDKFDPNTDEDCTNGIHFFRTFKGACGWA
jgi:hypothetical protein